MLAQPDFFLASTEDTRLTEPHRCWRMQRVANPTRDDLLLVKIDPPLSGETFGKGGRDLGFVWLATRHKGDSLFPISRWPVYVHVACPLIEAPEKLTQIQKEQYINESWAEL
ncbi:MAG TPA: hypothetical protein VHD85_19540, partial [Terracidiphilus sp.]|nr:hypothetical protein [Terracidiphilus sp.]